MHRRGPVWPVGTGRQCGWRSVWLEPSPRGPWHCSTPCSGCKGRHTLATRIQPKNIASLFTACFWCKMNCFYETSYTLSLKVCEDSLQSSTEVISGVTSMIFWIDSGAPLTFSLIINRWCYFWVTIMMDSGLALSLIINRWYYLWVTIMMDSGTHGSPSPW